VVTRKGPRSRAKPKSRNLPVPSPVLVVLVIFNGWSSVDGIFVIVLLRNFLVMAEWVNKDSSLGSLVFWGSSVRVLIG
jgi:hypothetical protein